MFLKYCFRTSTFKAVLFTVLGFIFWKSSASQFVIDVFNSFGILRIGRVVDWTDLLAFAILPLSIYVMDNLARFEIKINQLLVRKLVFNVLVFCSVFAFVATSEDSDFPDPENLIASCCVDDPSIAVFGTTVVYVPTAFTPDGDGINDVFQVSASANDINVNSILLTDLLTADTVFFKTNLIDLSPENGFDGVVNDTIVATQYQYEINISKEGDTLNLAGMLCCIPCQAPLEQPAPLNIDKCGFPVQFDPMTGFNSDLDNLEELDCFD